MPRSPRFGRAAHDVSDLSAEFIAAQAQIGVASAQDRIARGLQRITLARVACELELV
jgi:hypothetical protein